MGSDDDVGCKDKDGDRDGSLDVDGCNDREGV